MTQGNNWCVNHLCKFHSKYGLVHKSVFWLFHISALAWFVHKFIHVCFYDDCRKFSFDTVYLWHQCSQSVQKMKLLQNLDITEGFGILNCVETETKCKCSQTEKFNWRLCWTFLDNSAKRNNANMEPTDWGNLIWLPNGHTAKFAF